MSNKKIVVGFGVIIGFFILCAFVGTAFSQDLPLPETEAVIMLSNSDTVVPNPEEDLGGFLKFLVQAFQGKQWWVVGGLILMLLTYLVGKIFNVPTVWLPVVNAAMGMFTGLVVGFIATETPWYEDLYYGLLGSGPAALFWSALGKRVFPTPTKTNKST